jgi:hypothetical protein
MNAESTATRIGRHGLRMARRDDFEQFGAVEIQHTSCHPPRLASTA